MKQIFITLYSVHYFHFILSCLALDFTLLVYLLTFFTLKLCEDFKQLMARNGL